MSMKKKITTTVTVPLWSRNLNRYANKAMRSKPEPIKCSDFEKNSLAMHLCKQKPIAKPKHPNWPFDL